LSAALGAMLRPLLDWRQSHGAPLSHMSHSDLLEPNTHTQNETIRLIDHPFYRHV
jgi:hypothetical protein